MSEIPCRVPECRLSARRTSLFGFIIVFRGKCVWVFFFVFVGVACVPFVSENIYFVEDLSVEIFVA